MRHTHRELRRQTQRKLEALGSRRQRLLNLHRRVSKGLEQCERLTKPLMELLAELDAQDTPEAAPAATPSPSGLLLPAPGPQILIPGRPDFLR